MQNAGKQIGSQVNDIEIEDASSKKQMHEELKQRDLALITSS
jgi:hypothetical protein